MTPEDKIKNIFVEKIPKELRNGAPTKRLSVYFDFENDQYHLDITEEMSRGELYCHLRDFAEDIRIGVK